MKRICLSMLNCGVLLALLLAGWDAAAADEATIYQGEIKPLLQRKCAACHGALKQEASLRLDYGRGALAGGDSGPAVLAGQAEQSELIARVTAEDLDLRMPPEGEPLTAAQIALLRRWIKSGAKFPADDSPPRDPAHHWSFQPIRRPELPASDGATAIDRFINAELQAHSLQMAPPADRRTLMRRLLLELHGLPPSFEQVTAFAEDRRPLAYQRLVERALASPRYGERWAQHWLDIVRYADTHGFEVNTPRPNAWPYRDFVIDAFNSDTPYDQFIRQQLAGDARGADAATGFLVAAAVLLPGQIGKDEPSKRLARQEALDEIVVGASATLLGLTVGCARCHDHKFDPIPQRDYYAMQAFFAGVEYGERPIADQRQQQRRAEARQLESQIQRLEARLRQNQPPAFLGRTRIIDDEDLSAVELLQPKNGHGSNPPGTARGYLNDPGGPQRLPNISGGRYTWWPNRPGQDVLAYRPQVDGRFRLWISWGVHGSGVHTRDARFVLDHDGDLQTTGDQQLVATVDQHRFAYQRDGETEKQPLWSGLFDAGVHHWTEDTRLLVRGGETNTGVTADVIVLQEVPQQPPIEQFRADESVAEAPSSDVNDALAGRRLPALRDPVDFKHNIEAFPPVLADRIRFTTLATIDDNRHQPCIDELQAFSCGDVPTNVAAADRGAVPRSSGNYAENGIHQLKHINDGLVGNSHSWISSQYGGGWVEIQFAQPATIDRIQWSRDATGKFRDRLPVVYRIEAALGEGHWQLVASSQDRVPLGSPGNRLATLVRSSRGALGEQIAAAAEELQRLKARQQELRKPRQVFAGVFRTPDPTRVLQRGDPEQPGPPVGPQFLSAISSSLTPPDADATEQQRRLALAQWMASSDNPLPARVIVNRLWQHHFGTGLVETPSDFGVNGAAPSHGPLLDWLADELIRSGWSLKHIHRLILLSDTYRQSGRMDQTALQADGDGRLLWRFPPRRLEAEAIRDAMLQVSGQLNLQRGGPGFDFFQSRGGLSGFPPVTRFGPDKLRRMIYAHKVRMEPVPVFGAFDCPDAGQATPARSRSTTAIQALNLFNSPFVLEQAAALARQIQAAEAPDHVAGAFQRTLGRRPSETERQAAAAVVSQHGLTTLCRVLLNCNEFLHIP